MPYTRRLKYLIAVIVLASLFAILATTPTAHAATFTVNTTDDGNDATPGDGICEVNVGQDDCGLRALIEETNALGGADVGNFNIPGAGVHTFTPSSAYPDIIDQVTIDGSTQPGASCGTLVPASLPAVSNTPHTLMIQLSGENVVSGSRGLKFLNGGASNSLAKGLVVNRFTNGYGIDIDDGPSIPDNVTVECNYIGTDTAGVSALPNGIGIHTRLASNSQIRNNLVSGNTQEGIYTSDDPGIQINDNLIGTNADGITAIPNGISGIYMTAAFNATVRHNIVSGNVASGITVQGDYFTVNQFAIIGNYLGLNVEGRPLGNNGDGIAIYGANNFSIGGVLASQRNIISANNKSGIHLYKDCGASGNTKDSLVFNNYIGTTTNGAIQSGYGNGAAGIEVNEYHGGCFSVYKHQIGGDNAGEPNLIAGNTKQGILIHQSGGQDVFSVSAINNSIYANGQFGIDIAYDDNDDGVADTDLGPNLLNNYLMSLPTNGHANYYLNRPTITSTNFSGNQLTVNYSFQANQADNTTLFQTDVVGYRLDFYLNNNFQDGAYVGYNQGQTHLGSFVVNGSEANATHTFTSPVALSANQSVNATATVLWKNIPQSVCSNPDAYYGNGVPYDPCTPPQP